MSDQESVRSAAALLGRRGAEATLAKHDARQLTRRGREAFLSRFASAGEKSAYFSELARKSNAARRARKDAEQAEEAGR